MRKLFHYSFDILSCCLLWQGAGGRGAFRMRTRVYTPSIHTVILHKQGFDMSAPIIRLNSTEKLVLSFDDLREETAGVLISRSAIAI